MIDKVKIYTTEACGYCREAKDFFKKHGIVFEEIDVGTDQARAREMIERSGQMGVPVIIVGEGESDELIVGFDEPRLTKLLNI
jgi:glutaredoxin 3